MKIKPDKNLRFRDSSCRLSGIQIITRRKVNIQQTLNIYEKYEHINQISAYQDITQGHPGFATPSVYHLCVAREHAFV